MVHNIGGELLVLTNEALRLFLRWIAILNPMMASICGGIRAIHMGIVANHVSWFSWYVHCCRFSPVINQRNEFEVSRCGGIVCRLLNAVLVTLNADPRLMLRYISVWLALFWWSVPEILATPLWANCLSMNGWMFVFRPICHFVNCRLDSPYADWNVQSADLQYPRHFQATIFLPSTHVIAFFLGPQNFSLRKALNMAVVSDFPIRYSISRNQNYKYDGRITAENNVCQLYLKIPDINFYCCSFIGYLWRE